ncbi:DUF1080 domain-containing protein [Opitutaceae bacterium EW11]|nr:DUF1080 domain-containing protein [Opitutaceae bacterium EW11]
MKLLPLLMLLVAPILAAAAPAGAGWIPLFNGKDLSDWSQKGGSARFEVRGDEIVGTSVPNTPNSFLCTKRTFGDFVLEYDFQVDPRLNSGVQIRSQSFDAETRTDWDGRSITIPAGRVHGYQIEIDPDVKRGRLWTAGIYDEARRGWLFPSDGEKGSQGQAFSAQGRKLFRPGDWNHVRVEAIGDSLRTWLNGQPCAVLRDAMTPRGFIALQVHSIGSDASLAGAQVRWRNLRLKPMANTLSEAEKAEGWTLLWNGVDGEGWRGARTDTFPKSGWTIRDGVLTVLASGGAESSAGGDIITIRRYSDFELRLDFRITPGANSGVKYFVQPNLDPITGSGAKAQTGSAIGLEYQILDDERHPDAKLGRDGDRTLASVYDLIPASAAKRPNPIGEWNTARIVCRGRHVEHWLNGRKVAEYERGSAAFRDAVARSKYHTIPGFGEWQDGHLLLQDHGNEVSFQSIKLRDLSAK